MVKLKKIRFKLINEKNFNFKTDRVGDLINITPVINNLKLNNPDYKIDLICSSYNFQIAKYIIGINKFLFMKIQF